MFKRGHTTNTGSRTVRTLSWFEDELLASVVTATNATFKIRCRIHQLEEHPSDTETPIVDFNQEIEEDNNRRKDLEDKARGNLLAVTIAAAAIFAGINSKSLEGIRLMFQANGGKVALGLLLLSIAYFIIAAIAVLNALQVTGRYAAYTQGDSCGVNVLRWPLEVNRLKTTIQANYTYLSFKCLRNGIISLALFVAVVAMQIAVWGPFSAPT